MRLAIVALALLIPSTALALPQFAVRESRQCDNCHVQPEGWENPELAERKCSLSCTACHVNPTGGGLRNTSGLYYGRNILPMLKLARAEASSQTSTHAASSQPARPSAWGPTIVAQGQAAPGVPGPLSPDRYGGMDPIPWWRVGLDVRAMYYAPFAEGAESAFFPMQTDVYVAVSPYNPRETNKGRLTLLINGGALGSRGEKFEGFHERFLLREWFALFDDLPYQLYGKLGQFLPPFGWRFDDHTGYTRQNLTFNNERQVTGLEVGINPNYTYAHVALFVPGPLGNRGLQGDEPTRNRLAIISDADGFGAAASFGYRDFLWQAGGSFMYESREALSAMWAGINWGLNFHEAEHPWKPLSLLPIIYLGELDYARFSTESGDATNRLAALHQVDVAMMEGLFVQFRYDWQDPNLDIKDDHVSRYSAGVSVHPIHYLELIAQVRVIDEPQNVSNNDAFIQLHAWF